MYGFMSCMLSTDTSKSNSTLCTFSGMCPLYLGRTPIFKVASSPTLGAVLQTSWKFNRRAQLLRTTFVRTIQPCFFTSSGDSIREPGTFPGTLKISESREGDYKVSAAEVKWPPTNDLIYKFWNSAKGPFLSPPKACIKKLREPDLIKLFTALISSTLNIKHYGWLFQAEDFFPLPIPSSALISAQQMALLGFLQTTLCRRVSKEIVSGLDSNPCQSVELHQTGIFEGCSTHWATALRQAEKESLCHLGTAASAS